MKTDYEQQANDFLSKVNATIEIVFKTNGIHLEGDKTKRDIYTVTIKRGDRKMTFDFGQSIIKSQYYKDDLKKGCTYTTSGKARTGNYSVTEKYLREFCGKPIKGEAPTNYDILACLTKHDPGTFENFCSEFGYDEDSRKAEKIYKAVKEEYTNLCTLFTDDELNLLSEIQ
jgi:sRNA-binding regulator protein Hfq